jgi:hypothetical protein
VRQARDTSVWLEYREYGGALTRRAGSKKSDFCFEVKKDHAISMRVFRQNKLKTRMDIAYKLLKYLVKPNNPSLPRFGIP